MNSSRVIVDTVGELDAMQEGATVRDSEAGDWVKQADGSWRSGVTTRAASDILSRARLRRAPKCRAAIGEAPADVVLDPVDPSAEPASRPASALTVETKPGRVFGAVTLAAGLAPRGP